MKAACPLARAALPCLSPTTPSASTSSSTLSSRGPATGRLESPGLCATLPCRPLKGALVGRLPVNVPRDELGDKNVSISRSALGGIGTRPRARLPAGEAAGGGSVAQLLTKYRHLLFPEAKCVELTTPREGGVSFHLPPVLLARSGTLKHFLNATRGGDADRHGEHTGTPLGCLLISLMIKCHARIHGLPGNFREQEGRIALPQYGAGVVEEVVEYLARTFLIQYRGAELDPFVPQPENILELMDAALYLDLPDLVQQCARLVSSHIAHVPPPPTLSYMRAPLTREIMRHLGPVDLALSERELLPASFDTRDCWAGLAYAYLTRCGSMPGLGEPQDRHPFPRGGSGADGGLAARNSVLVLLQVGKALSTFNPPALTARSAEESLSQVRRLASAVEYVKGPASILTYTLNTDTVERRGHGYISIFLHSCTLPALDITVCGEGVGEAALHLLQLARDKCAQGRLTMTLDVTRGDWSTLLQSPLYTGGPTRAQGGRRRSGDGCGLAIDPESAQGAGKRVAWRFVMGPNPTRTPGEVERLLCQAFSPAPVAEAAPLPVIQSVQCAGCTQLGEDRVVHRFAAILVDPTGPLRASLHTLSLEGCALGLKGLLILVPGLVGLPSLGHLNLARNIGPASGATGGAREARPGSDPIQEAAGMQEEGFRTLAHLLSQLRGVRTLGLAGNHFSNLGLRKVLEGVKRIPTLRELDVSAIQLGANISCLLVGSVLPAAPAPGAAVMSSGIGATLRVLRATDNGILSRYLDSCLAESRPSPQSPDIPPSPPPGASALATLTTLDLSGNWMDAASGGSLARLLLPPREGGSVARLPCLSRLLLRAGRGRGNYCPPDGLLHHLFPALQEGGTSLKLLDLSGHPMPLTCVRALAERVLPCLRKLQSLGLESCGIGARGLHCLVQSFLGLGNARGKQRSAAGTGSAEPHILYLQLKGNPVQELEAPGPGTQCDVEEREQGEGLDPIPGSVALGDDEDLDGSEIMGDRREDDDDMARRSPEPRLLGLAELQSALARMHGRPTDWRVVPVLAGVGLT